MLDVGATVRYCGLGAGKVLRHVVRPFSGEERIFAVIYFEHSRLEAQVPLGDPAIASKIESVLAASTLQKLLRGIKDGGSKLQRTWDAREEEGDRAIREGGPKEWASLLASYAEAEGRGVSVAASDEELVRKATELLASELACASDKDYRSCLLKVEEAYATAVAGAAASGAERAESFAGVSEAHVPLGDPS